MWYEKSPETKEYEKTVVDLAHRKQGPESCRCGSDKVIWGGTARESVIRCEKCERYVTGPTIEDAMARWTELEHPEIHGG